MHASYTDVTAEDFLYVQTDTQYRKEWDRSAVALDIVDVDPANRAKSQVVYWEMQWPVNDDIFQLISLFYSVGFKCSSFIQYSFRRTSLKMIISIHTNANLIIAFSSFKESNSEYISTANFKY